MPGSKANALWRQHILERIGDGWRGLVDRGNDGFVLVRTGNGEHIWMDVADGALIYA